MNETTSIRASFLIVSLLSLIWLGLAIWAMVSEGTQPTTAFGAIQAFGFLLAPVAALFALAAALGNRERLPTLAAPDSLEDSEARLAGAMSRLETLKAGLSEELAVLKAATEALDTQSQAARTLVADIEGASRLAMEAGRRLEQAVPAATTASEGLRATLASLTEEAARQADRADAAAATLAERLSALSGEGSAAADRLTAALAALEEKAAAGRAQSEAGMRAIRGEADTLFELLENTLVARREALQRQGDALAGQLSDAYQRLETMAASLGKELVDRLDAFAAQAEAIDSRLKAQAATTEALAASGERAFQLLDARLQHSGETSRAALDRLATRVQEVGAGFAQLTQPIRETQGAAVDLESAVARLRETTLNTADVLADLLPRRAVEASSAAETLAADIASLVAALDDAQAKALGLAEPIAQSRAAIEEASAAYAEQRESLESAGRALIAELEQARGMIAEVEEQTRDTSLQAATRLVEAMGRVRDVATQATGTMREMLDGLLAEARESLAHSADETMRRSFAEPVAARAREAEEAAAAAAERTAASMAQLASALQLLEKRTTDRLTAIEEAQQKDLLASAALLTDRLAQVSTSLSAALGKPMDDRDWTLWRKGERGLFSRRALTLLSKREARDLRVLIETDRKLAETARQYTAAFEGLIDRLQPGLPALAAALRNSEHGRLSAALSEALDS
ncbi:MAG: hypothetical protein ACK4Z0_03175 [Sphingomonadaceae bacterium]